MGSVFVDGGCGGESIWIGFSEGGEPAMKAEMKAWVWRASGEGSGGEAVDMVLGILLLLCVVGIADWRDECSSSVLIIVVAVQ